jgi:hypothetical protein
MPLVPNPRMPRPDHLPPQDLAELLAAIQEVLWKQSRANPDDRRDYLDYWNPHKEWDDDELEEIALLLTDAGLSPPEDMPCEVWPEDAPAEATFEDLEQRWTVTKQPQSQQPNEEQP